MKLKYLTLFVLCSCLCIPALFAQPWLTSGSNIYYTAGNVGIGTSSPTKPLHIVGDVLATGNITSPGSGTYSEKFGVYASSAGLYSVAFGWNTYANTFGTAVGGAAIAGNASGQNYNVAVGSACYNYGSYSTAVGTSSTITSGTGFGIVLGYNSSTAHYGGIIIGNNAATTKNNQAILGTSTVGAQISEFVIGMGVKSAYANLYQGVVIKTTDGDGTNINGSDLSIKAGSGTGTGTGGFISFSTAPAGSTGSTLNTAVESMRITSQGNIGIGTTAPNANAKLHVVGNIYCNNKVYIGTPDANTTTRIGNYSLAVNGTAMFTKAMVKLYGSWADYVFDPSYELTDLHTLESYILKNRHLPSVPTAAEVEKDGIDLGQNQTILLKKIEELTLYIIKLNKKVEQLELQNKQLQQDK